MRGSLRSNPLTGHDSMRSYASSNAIPIGIPDYYLHNRDSDAPSIPDPPSEYADDDDEDDYNLGHFPMQGSTAAPQPLHVPHRDARQEYDGADENDHGDYANEERRDMDREEPSPDPGALIVRQASLGRKSKPTLTTVKSGERIRKDSASAGDGGLASLPSQARAVPPSTQQAPRYPEPVLDKELGRSARASGDSDDMDLYMTQEKALEAGGAFAATGGLTAPSTHRNPKDVPTTPSSGVMSTSTGILGPSSTESVPSLAKQSSRERLGPNLPYNTQKNPRDRSPLSLRVDPDAESVLRGVSPNGGGANEGDQLRVPGAGMSDRAGKRRPPRLNVDAVREAEARGSLTSLPDLIKRATRLASNLDRGKTASRLGMNWFDGAEEDEKRKSGTSGNRRSAGSLSDMLASFPPPGLATPPPGARNEMGRSTMWPSYLRHSQLASESDAGEQRARQRSDKKRVCGMPLWLFLVLLAILILLVAAAIIVPVVLVVVPKQRASSSTNAVRDSAAAKCTSSLSCQNGGTSIVGVADGKCHCVCVSGYTGSTCGVAADSACTSLAVDGASDASVGTALPRLLNTAQSNFNIPLDSATLLGLFSDQNVTCSEENALVTFNGAATKRSEEQPLLFTDDKDDLQPAPTTNELSRRTAQTGAATSNGIIFETGSPSSSASAAAATGSASTASASAASSTSSASPSSSSSSSVDASSTDLDFARIAILYILQSTGQINDAAAAQSNLQSYFSGTLVDGNSTSVALANGATCDLSALSIELANGTVVGGKGPAS